MLSFTFRVLGALAIVLGVLWAGFVMAADVRAVSTGVALFWAEAFAVSPGFGLIFSGLLLLAIGEALSHLGQIARNTADVADGMEALAAASNLPREDAATNFADALQLFQAKTGKTDNISTTRDLATDTLRQQGFLK